MIKENRLKIQIHIIGDGHLYQNFLRNITQHKLEGVIKTYGYLEHSKAMLKLSEMDLGITTSPIEMMPNFVLECFAVGIPVVGYNVPGIQDLIINGFNGYLIKPNDTQVFVTCLESFTQNTSKLSGMSKNAQFSALEYSPVNIGNKLKKFYQKIVK